MKNIKLLSLLLIAFISFSACDQDDDLVFTAQEPAEGITFSNSFLDEYVLTVAASNNLGERFTWQDANFGVPTNVTYELENSILGDFTDATTVGTTDGNELAVTIGAMLGFAEAAGLDNDPNTDLPNTGTLYFRVKGFVGTEGLPTYSPIQELTVVLPEIVEGGGGAGIEISDWGIVGSATPNSWDGPDIPFYTTSENNVIVAYANLVDGQIKFRQNNSWDAPNINYGDLTGDGILDTENENNINVTSGTYKITIDWNDNSYTIEEFYWGLVGSATPNSWDGPDVKLSYDYNTDTFKTVVQLVDGQIKIRMNDSWDSPNINYGDLTGDGVLDTENENNINVTAGYYLVTVDFKTLEYSIEETLIWGAVGSATPNSWDGPDTKFNPDFANPGVWTLNGMTLLDGQLKFRTNDSWDSPNINYGDLTGDGILDTENENNINVTAGIYDITLDFSNPDNPTYTIE
ncbi:SusF/SusE family outer membrane protein [Algibacter sp.]|uniref:SusF/SusE family outer membrane protein n=1 Tax=Algibacter sp. TaxID=1872428 RepID=UPI003C714B4F